MSLSAIKDALITKCAAVTGVTTVFNDLPSKPPERSQCPAVEIAFRDPSLSVKPVASGLTNYTWHFQVRFMLYPIGVETLAQKEIDIEPYPARFVAMAMGNNTLSATAKFVGFESDFKIGFFSFLGTDYYGFTWDLDVVEYIAETYAP